jgi:hypothetical protein
MSVDSSRVQFQVSYESTPIILTGGITTAQGGAVPIIQYIQPGVASFDNTSATSVGQLTSFTASAPYTLFATFRPISNGSLISQQMATYPFANQAIAANAVIAQPLNVSMLMMCPAGVVNGYIFKQSTITSLVGTLTQHNASGGTYSVATPAFIYTNGILTGMRDVSGGESNQAQFQFQLDFFFPLLSLAQAQQALNNLNATISNGTPPAGGSSLAPGMASGNPTIQSTQGPTQSSLGTNSIIAGSQ